MSIRATLYSLLTVVVMFLIVGGLAVVRARSEKTGPTGIDLRLVLTSTMKNPFFWIATIAWAALTYKLTK